MEKGHPRIFLFLCRRSTGSCAPNSNIWIMKTFGILFTLLLMCGFVDGQSVGINTNGAIPNQSAILDLADTTKGFLMPRMTIAQRMAIHDPATGLTVYQTDSLRGHYVFDGSHWKQLGQNSGAVEDQLQIGILDTTDLHVYYLVPISPISDTSGLLYDSGGPDQPYGNDEDVVFHLLPLSGAIGVRIRILYVETESPYDSLTIRTANSPEEGRFVFSGSEENICLPLLRGVFSGVKIEFKSNGVNTDSGFALRWDWVFPPQNASQEIPVAGWYYNTSKLAMRGGINLGNAWHTDSVGVSSFGWGDRVIASGAHSVAIGFRTRAGNYSTALGLKAHARGQQSFCAGSSVASGNFSTAIGTYCEALDEHSVAIGRGAITSGRRAVSLGHNNTAAGYGSVAFGIESVASGHGAIAMGYRSRAVANYSIGLGYETNAKGTAAIASGRFTQANGYNSFVIGQFNDTIVGPQHYISEGTPLFIIGNGSSMTSRSNAFVVRHDGTVGIGASTPSELLQVGTTTGDGIRIGSYEVLSDAGATMLQVNAAFIPETDNTFDLGTSARRWDDVWATNGVIQTSDARDKENITELESGLETLMQLRPVRYQWKEGPDRSFQIGLLAQEVQDVIPGVVRSKNFIQHEDGTVTEEPTERLGMNYSALIPVLIKATQDLHSENTSLRADLEKLGAENAVLKQSLESRLSAVEAEMKALERK